ncbi:MAG: T9SS type A sorting domain-containing protein [Candidatus Latescibacteria bacterium]|nr:T9SS type A sorting domain-containing protein [Candidatus Latescibacterota bacterium]
MLPIILTAIGLLWTASLYAGTWQLERPLQGTGGWLVGVQWLDARQGWIAGTQWIEDTPSTVLLRSSDGGLHWQTLPPLQNALFSEVRFATPQLGYAVGRLGTEAAVWRTEDGGGSWTRVFAQLAGAGWAMDVSVPHPDTVWVSGFSLHRGPCGRTENGFTHHGGFLISSTDGGDTWHNHAEQNRCITGWSEVSFINPQQGWIAYQGSSPAGSAVIEEGQFATVQVTSDGGRTWAPVPETETWDHHQWTVQQAFFLDQQQGYLLTNNFLLETLDGGRTWEVSEVPERSFALSSPAPDRLWLGGHRLHVRKAAGQPWTEEPLPAYLPENLGITEIAFSDSLTGWAVGRDGLVLRYYGREPQGIYEPNPDDFQVWDRDGDGILRAGEAMYVVFVPPAGTEKANLSVSGRVSSADPSFEPVHSAGPIDFPVHLPSLQFTASAAAFGSGEMAVVLDLTDVEGRAWQRTYNIPVRSPRLPVAGLEVLDGRPQNQGNDDGALQPGEHVRVGVALAVADSGLLEGNRYRLRPGDQRMQPLDDGRLSFVTGAGQLRSESAPEFLVGADLGQGPVPLVLEARGPYATRLDTLWVAVGPGEDRIPPQITGPLQSWYGEEGLTLLLSQTDLIEGSAIASVAATLVAADGSDSVHTTLERRTGFFLGTWRNAVPGEYRLTFTATDAAGNASGEGPMPLRIEESSPTDALIPIVGGGRQITTGLGPFIEINRPEALAIDDQSAVYIGGSSDHIVYRWNRNGVARPVAGTGERGLGREGVDALETPLEPGGIAVDKAGRLYISDTKNNRIRRIDLDGKIRTIAGSAKGFSGDGGPAVDALFDYPQGLAFDAAGNLYVCDLGNRRVRRITPNGIITTIAGDGTPQFGSNGAAALATGIGSPRDIVVAPDGVLYFSNSTFRGVIRMDTDGTLTLYVADSSSAGLSVEPTIDAPLWSPNGLALDGEGSLYIASSGNKRIFKVDKQHNASIVANFNDGLEAPRGLAIDREGTLYIGDTRAHRVFMGKGLAAPAQPATAIAGSGLDSPPPGTVLHANHPNPFNAATSIRFSLAQSVYVELAVYTVLGQRVRSLLEGQRAAGTHQVHWDGRDQTGRPVGSGLYIYRIETGPWRSSRKMMVLR